MTRQVIRLLGAKAVQSEEEGNTAGPGSSLHMGASTANVSGQFPKIDHYGPHTSAPAPVMPAGRPFEATYLAQILASEAAFARRHHTQLSLVVLELDCQSPDDPDELRFAHWLSDQVRQEDLIVKGERRGFIVVLRGTGLEGARTMATRLCLSASRDRVAFATTETPRLRAGCASLESCGSDPQALVAFAERRLRLAQDTESMAIVGDSSLSCLVTTPSTQGDDAGVRLERVVRHTARAIERLPHELQVVLALRYQLECPFDEIAAYLDVSEMAAQELHDRALAALEE